MKLHLTFLILLPLIASFLEAFLSKYFKKVSGLISIFAALAVVFISLIFYYDFNPLGLTPQFVYHYPWIPDWGISFKLGLDGINSVGIILFSFIFLIISIISRREYKNNLYYTMLMITEAAVFGFLLSYDLILKILFWEATWIPVFFLLLTLERKRFAILYSKSWFISELLIITASILLFNNIFTTYDLEKIMITPSYPTQVSTWAFYLFMVGIMIRCAIFPFDGWIIQTIKRCSSTTSLITGAIILTLPFFFLLHVISPVFPYEFKNNMPILVTILLFSFFVWVIRLYLDKKIDTIISSQLIIFNSLMLIWLIKPTEILLQASVEILTIKTALNVLIIYFGKKVIEESHKNGLKNLINYRPIESWLFTISVVLSFGLPGLVLIKPLLVLISSWYSISMYIGLSVLILLIFAFIFTSINISTLFAPEDKLITPKIKITTNTVLLVIVLCSIIFISLVPNALHELSSSYYINYLSRGY